ncbi:MAG TPA: TIGR03435 family protein [Vicinamibacterales bacterium]|nr:TIGR03435 family protein [Vicinamibacterales bacterium]
MKHVFVAIGIGISPCVLPAQAPPAFDAVEIVVSESDRPVANPASDPAHGVIALTGTTTRTIIGLAYPEVTESTLQTLPEWSATTHYDVLATFRPGAPRNEQMQMWRMLLASRWKLQAHEDIRDRSSYALVRRGDDATLGPNLRPSTLDCAPPERAQPVPPSLEVLHALRDTTIAGQATAAAEQLFMSVCRSTFNAGTAMYSGGVPIDAIARHLAQVTRRTVVDRTGLRDLYAVKFTVPQQSANGDGSEIEAAVEAQLGLRLERIPGRQRVLVIDHIERPTED